MSTDTLSQLIKTLQINVLSYDKFKSIDPENVDRTAFYLTPAELVRGQGTSSLVNYLDMEPGNPNRAFQPRATGATSIALGPYNTCGVIGLDNISQGQEGKYDLVINPLTGLPIPVKHAVALGYGVTAMGNFSMAINRGTWAIGDASFAVNRATQAAGYESMSAGENTRSFGRFSLALGRYSVAGGSAYQYDTNNDGSRTYKLDENGQYIPIEQIANLIAQDPENGLSSSSNIPGDCAFVFGLRSFADASYSFAGGFQSIANGESAVALGRNTLASGFTSIALGQSVQATGQNSIAIGLNAIASKIGSVAIGNNAQASADGAAAFNAAIASGQFSAAFGKATASGNYSLAAGYNQGTIEAPRANALGSVAFGLGTVAGGALSMAVGQECSTAASYAFAGGMKSKVLADANGGFAFGNNAQAQKKYSAAFGQAAYAKGEYSFASGYYAFAEYNYSVAFGKYNAKTIMEKDVLFGYGAGSSNTARRNLFSVLADGDVVAHKDLYSNGMRIPNIHKGTEEPTSDIGVDGDIYILY
jgi:autotransporter adhesin